MIRRADGDDLDVNWNLNLGKVDSINTDTGVYSPSKKSLLQKSGY